MNGKNRRKKEIVVVVHDAGGAEVIGAYIRKRLKDYAVHAYGAGPARAVFRRLGIPLSEISADRSALARMMAHHKDAAFALLAAPGWMVRTELHALEEAKRAGLKTIVYMDSWIDDRKRFGFPRPIWKKRLPDELWAGDRFAYENLQRQFKQFRGTRIRLVPNEYFADEVRRFHALKKTSLHPRAILFMSTTGRDSRLLLSGLLKVLGKERRPIHVRIRFHPADSRARYDSLIKTHTVKVHIEKSESNDLVKDIVQAQCVIGTETVAMAISALCKVPTVSYVREGAHPILHFAQVRRAHSIEASIKKMISAVGKPR